MKQRTATKLKIVTLAILLIGLTIGLDDLEKPAPSGPTAVTSKAIPADEIDWP